MRRRPVPLHSIRVLVLDVDGVLTDGRLHYGPDGEQIKLFHVRDGYGIRALQSAGITVAVISGRQSNAVQRRCADLGIVDVQQGIDDKASAFAALLARLGVTARACCCVGDDVPDLPLLRAAGLAVAPADAHAQARRVAHRITRLPGGAGAVREICDWLLAARSRAVVR